MSFSDHKINEKSIVMLKMFLHGYGSLIRLSLSTPLSDTSVRRYYDPSSLFVCSLVP